MKLFFLLHASLIRAFIRTILRLPLTIRKFKFWGIQTLIHVNDEHTAVKGMQRRRRRRFSWLIVVQVVREQASERGLRLSTPVGRPVGRGRYANGPHEGTEETRIRRWVPCPLRLLHNAHARQSQIAPYTAQAPSCVLIWSCTVRT